MLAATLLPVVSLHSTIYTPPKSEEVINSTRLKGPKEIQHTKSLYTIKGKVYLGKKHLLANHATITLIYKNEIIQQTHSDTDGNYEIHMPDSLQKEKIWLAFSQSRYYSKQIKIIISKQTLTKNIFLRRSTRVYVQEWGFPTDTYLLSPTL